MNNIDDDDAVKAAAVWAEQDFSKGPFLSRDEEDRLLAQLPKIDPDEQIMVSRSLRLTPELANQIKDAAKKEGVSGSEWIRRAIQRALTGASSNQIDVDAAINALRNLPRAV